MKILKFIGILLLVVVVIVLVAGALMKKDFHYEKSITINASKDKVWENAVMFKNHEKWSQWKEMDPAMKTTITGTDGTVGAKMSWESENKNVGKGSQTITAITPGERVDTDLDFDGKGKAKAYMIVTGDSATSKAVWGIDMSVPYPMNAIVGVMMGSEGMNVMLDKGLGMLKTASEKE